MKYFELPVAYLENDDFREDGSIDMGDISSSIPVVVMVQTKWCGHCDAAKPEFQKFASKHHDKIIAATIEVDGDRPGEIALQQRLKQLFPSFKGFPHYALFKDGKLVENHEIKNRSLAGIENFAYLG